MVAYNQLMTGFRKAAANGALAEGAIGVIPSIALHAVAGPLAGIPAMTGSVAASLQDAPTKAELSAQNDMHPAMSLVPGVADYQLARRRRRLTADLGTSRTAMWSEVLGPATALLASAALGGAAYTAYRALNDGQDVNVARSAEIGATVGGLAGLGAYGVGGLLAAIKRGRTMKEQLAYERDTPTAQNYLVPGVGAYNWFKSLGVAGRRS